MPDPPRPIPPAPPRKTITEVNMHNGNLVFGNQGDIKLGKPTVPNCIIESVTMDPPQRIDVSTHDKPNQFIAAGPGETTVTLRLTGDPSEAINSGCFRVASTWWPGREEAQRNGPPPTTWPESVCAPISRPQYGPRDVVYPLLWCGLIYVAGQVWRILGEML